MNYKPSLFFFFFLILLGELVVGTQGNPFIVAQGTEEN